MDQEVVAELSAEVVSYLMGYEINGRSRDYINHYTRKDWKKVFTVLNRVNKVVAYITEKAKIEDSVELEVKGKLDMLQAAEVAAATA